MNNFSETAYLILVLVSAGTALGWLARLLQRRERLLPAIFLAVSAVTLWLLLAPEMWIIDLFIRLKLTSDTAYYVLSFLHRPSRWALGTYTVLTLVPLAVLLVRAASRPTRPTPRPASGKKKAHPAQSR